MQYRKLDALGDMTFGQRSGNFYKDSPSAVGQAVVTRLRLIQGEWMLDTTAGTPYTGRVVGAGKLATFDAAIQQVIINTQGVKRIASYASAFDPASRRVSIVATIDTVYGQTTVKTEV